MFKPSTIAQELERKTLEELDRIVHELQTSRLTTVEARASVLTLWQLVAGLVPKATMELVSQTRESLPITREYDEQLVLRRAKAVAYLTRRKTGVSVRLMGYEAKDDREVFNEFDTEREASEHLTAKATTLVKNGFYTVR